MGFKVRYLVLFVFVVLATGTSFGQITKSWKDQYPELVAENSSKWILQSTSNSQTLSRVIEVGIDLERKSIVGFGGCNPFQINVVSVKKKNDYYRILTSRDVMTENLCTENINKNERQLLHNLHYNRLKVKIDKDEMVITNKKKVVMTFNRKKENPLFRFMSRYYWKLIQLEGNSSVVYQSYFYFDFEKHKLVGDAGCGPFEVGFEISPEEDELVFSEVKYTNIGCIDHQREDRSQCFVDLLNNGTFSFDVAEQTLNFYQNNRIVMMFGFIPKGY